MLKPSLLAASSLLAIWYLKPGHLFALGKEIEGTSEWQLLKEGDTIPAGLHVRMDLSTGEKWVKLVDKTTKEPEVVPTLSSSSSSLSIVAKDNDKLSHSSPTEDKRPVYDFEMMHRALSKLPDDEKLRMGGLPPLPSEESSKEETVAFRTRMKDLWENRQKEIAQAQDHLANLPEILKTRIQTLRTYLDEGTVVEDDMSLIATLEDLEFQLNDLDNARDFHTLGGWPLLVSLLSNDVHPANATDVPPIQSVAAWVMGTAVKNTEEFYPWAVEPLTRSQMTPVSLLVTLIPSSHLKLKQKVLYALGGLIRGNTLAYPHFLEAQGPQHLVVALEEAIAETNWKIAGKIISLVQDIISDIVLEDIDTELLTALSKQEWCHGALELVKVDDVTVKEKGLGMLKLLGPKCGAHALPIVKKERENLQVQPHCQDQNEDETDTENDETTVCDGVHEHVKTDTLQLMDEAMAAMA